MNNCYLTMDTPSTSRSSWTPSSRDTTAPPSFIDLNKALESHLLNGLDLGKVKDFLVEVAKRGGEMMRDADPTVDSSLEKKNSADRVTETDRAIEAMVKASVSKAFPELAFLGEETFKTGQKLCDEPTVVCDPIDGTLNFIHGFPNYAISLALTVCKQPVVAVVYNPTRGDLFTAIKGRGSFLTRWDGKTVSLPIKARAEPIEKLADCLCALEWGSDRSSSNWELRTHMTEALLSNKGAMAHSMRSSGSAALDFCYVGAGWLDLFWEGGCWIWDVCAGWLIVQEAGGIVVGANPGEWNPTLEGRSYFAVRGASSGQQEVVQELWSLMGEKRFVFPQ
jgi:myo-inositol-1(or 4)-monophosphatase